MAQSGRGEDLYNQIRRTLAAKSVQFAGITNDRDVRLHHRVHIFGAVITLFKKPDSKGSGVNSAFFPFEIFVELPE